MAEIAPDLLRWFDRHGRHDLPWQQPTDAYRVWVSEIMLQQTQVSTVIPYFQRFMQRFPDVHTLAAAAEDEVLHHWTGLGYYSRARNLHRAARELCQRHDGRFPRSVSELSALPGIGPSTAGAIASIALGVRAPILDGNVKRVLARLHRVPGWPGHRAVAKRLWELAERHTPHQRVADYTQAVMDLGATLCTPRRPACTECPLVRACAARAAGDPEAYPGRKPRRQLPVRRARFVILQSSSGDVLLERREGAGVWRGLYCFPELDADTGIEADIETAIAGWCRHRGLQPRAIQPWRGFRHTFSHYHLDIDPVHVELDHNPSGVMADDRQLWYDTRAPASIGLAAPVKKLLSALTAAPLLPPEDS